jgi:hypothetical protein
MVPFGRIYTLFPNFLLPDWLPGGKLLSFFLFLFVGEKL